MRSALSRSLCHMYHLQASRRLSQPWPQSPRCGDRLKERTGKRERLSNDGSENNPPTWLPAEMKKCNECCYYYRLHQWCIKQLRRAEDITNVTLSDPRLMSSYPRSNRLRDSKIAQREIWCNPEKKERKAVIPKRWATSLVDERKLDFIAVWNPNMLEQLVGSLMRGDWKLTTRLDFQTSHFFCSHRNLSAIPI